MDDAVQLITSFQEEYPGSHVEYGPLYRVVDGRAVPGPRIIAVAYLSEEGGAPFYEGVGTTLPAALEQVRKNIERRDEQQRQSDHEALQRVFDDVKKDMENQR